MNDCVWSIILCKDQNCANCKKKININSRNGRKLREQYEKDVQEALTPVFDKYFDKMNKI